MQKEPLQEEDAEMTEEVTEEVTEDASAPVQEEHVEGAETAEKEEEPMVTDDKKEEKADEVKPEASSEATKPAEQQQQPQQPQQPQQQRRVQKRKFDENEPYVVVEDEPEIDEDLVCLDWFNSDLNLKIDPSDLSTAEPLSKDGWGYVWAGARATYGFVEGKIRFEVKLLEHLEAKGVEGEKEAKRVHEVRVGWSADDSPLMLGETSLSFCYAGSAKKARASTFEAYGDEFAKDDVVSALLDLSGDEAVFSFEKNGQSQGEAFRVPKSELEGKALFPHVSTRNVKIDVNLGKKKDGEDREAAAKSDAEDYIFAAQVDKEKRQRGMER